MITFHQKKHLQFLAYLDHHILGHKTVKSNHLQYIFDKPLYNLEVSSPGLNRPLKSMAGFERFVGRLAKIKTTEPIAGEHVFIGKINKTEGESIVLEVGTKEVTILFSQVAKARLEVEF